MRKSRSISSRAQSNASPGCLMIFGALFFFPGLAVLIFMGLLPCFRVVSAANWVPTPARVQSSEIVSVRGSESTTYRAEISYLYNFDGRAYSSSAFSFAPRTIAGYNGAAQRNAQFPAGAAVTCYVNPSAPAQAVLQRGFSTEFLWGLFGIPFMLAPLLLLKTSGKSARSAGWQPKGAAVLEASPSGGVRLQTHNGTPATRAAGIGAFALFWNGLVGVFLVQMVFKAPMGVFTIFPALFLIPFVLIGLFLIWLVLEQLGALFNPRVESSFSRETVRLGEEIEFSFRFVGGSTKTQGVKIALEGREEATFRRGTDTITEKSAFFYELLHESNTAQTSGAVIVKLPAASMHSFEAPNNKILWILRLEAPVSRWPDVREEWKLNVLPGESAPKTSR